MQPTDPSQAPAPAPEPAQPEPSVAPTPVAPESAPTQPVAESASTWQQPTSAPAPEATVQQPIASPPTPQQFPPVSETTTDEAVPTPAVVDTPDDSPEPTMSTQPAVAQPTVQNEFTTDQPMAEEATPANEGEDELVRWTATEHIHREKDIVWYLIFAGVVVVLIALAIFLVRSWTFAILIPVMAAALVLYARRPPAMLEYTLSRKGLHVGDRLYEYDTFKEFGLIQDDDEHAVMLVPRKRFQPGVTVYFPEEVGEPVVDMLAARLPMHEVKLDPIDRLIRRLHI